MPSCESESERVSYCARHLIVAEQREDFAFDELWKEESTGEEAADSRRSGRSGRLDSSCDTLKLQSRKPIPLPPTTPRHSLVLIPPRQLYILHSLYCPILLRHSNRLFARFLSFEPNTLLLAQRQHLPHQIHRPVAFKQRDSLPDRIVEIDVEELTVESDCDARPEVVHLESGRMSMRMEESSNDGWTRIAGGESDDFGELGEIRENLDDVDRVGGTGKIEILRIDQVIDIVTPELDSFVLLPFDEKTGEMRD